MSGSKRRGDGGDGRRRRSASAWGRWSRRRARRSRREWSVAGCGVVVGEVMVTSSSARSGFGCEVTSLCSRAGEIAGGNGSISVAV